MIKDIGFHYRMEKMLSEKNFFGNELVVCSKEPLTGFNRNGCCESVDEDYGKHIVCAQVDKKFLEFSLKNGNDLITPKKEFGFFGLKDGDRWCLCAGRWFQAYESGYAPKIILSSTSIEVVKYIDRDILKKFALDLN